MTERVQPSGPTDPRKTFTAPSLPDFGKFSHEELLAMIEHADPEKVHEIASKLHEAAQTVHDIGRDLKEHMSRVDWEGEGADAFHAWGGSMANATTQLGAYAEKAGDWMQVASNALSAAKKMPKVPASAKSTVEEFDRLYPGIRGNPLLFNDDITRLKGGPSTFQVTSALQTLRKEHDEAASAMTKLASAYNDSGAELTKATRPNFPPMPGTMMPPPGSVEEAEYLPGPGGGAGAGGAAAGGAGYGAAAAGSGQEPSGPSSVTGSHGNSTSSSGADTSTGVVSPPHGDRSEPSTDSSTRSDSVVKTVPSLPNVPATPNGGPPTTPSPHGPHVPPPVVHPHVPTPHTSKIPPVTSRTPGRMPSPSKPEGRTGPVVTGPGSPGTRRVPGIPGVPGGPGSSPGTGRVGMPSSAPRVPASEVIGGRPAPRAAAPSPLQTPRGTVVGAEPVHGAQGMQGRPGMAGPGFGGVPGAPGGGRGVGAGGRRLASEAGGVVGGSTQNGSRAFTQGGTGLVRTPDDRQRHSRRGKRPDYLVEDEESWPSHDGQRNVPPVIG
ncbi:WXG100 family type VII secretion target [Streptomyces caatingaensis]|uniref:PPE family domain-containing protein n=1 Tax=Streptomyces caatingaensis TaxID=1678637 RepID=A0A0K9X7C1_9ACTN|nr:hypothetical protein [Streptomyces caatingaensis]KNB49339.1 hypothetical protein AC230_29150 [Streptomyces caatingaensis]